MSAHFDANWLALREAADASARDRALVARARDWLADRPRPLRITDLGAGSGSNPRYLARHLPGPQHWRLVDHDAELLGHTQARLANTNDADGGRLKIEIAVRDLADANAAIADETDLATASALFDLVSAEWVEALAARCAAVGCAALWTLSIDGHWNFTCPDGNRVCDTEDAEMMSLLQSHQKREKGLGQALGGGAPGALRSAFARHGYNIAEAPSPWRLVDSSQRDLAVSLLDGWRAALHEQSPGSASRIDTWWRDRRAAIHAGELGVVVGHVDFLAVPPA